MGSTFRNVVRSVRSGGGAETTTADEARRMEGRRCSSLPLADRGRLGTADASGGNSDSSDAAEPGHKRPWGSRTGPTDLCSTWLGCESRLHCLTACRSGSDVPQRRLLTGHRASLRAFLMASPHIISYLSGRLLLCAFVRSGWRAARAMSGSVSAMETWRRAAEQRQTSVYLNHRTVTAGAVEGRGGRAPPAHTAFRGAGRPPPLQGAELALGVPLLAALGSTKSGHSMAHNSAVYSGVGRQG